MLTSVRLQNDVSMANLNVAKKSEKQKHEVQLLCISSISPQFHHYFLLQHKHIIAIMPLDKWCHIIHSHCHDFLHRMVYSFLHILQFLDHRSNSAIFIYCTYDQCSKTARDCIETSFKQLPRECLKKGHRPTKSLAAIGCQKMQFSVKINCPYLAV